MLTYLTDLAYLKLNYKFLKILTWHYFIHVLLHTSQLSFSCKGGGHGLKFSFKKPFAFESFLNYWIQRKSSRSCVEGRLKVFYFDSSLYPICLIWGAICKRMGMRIWLPSIEIPELIWCHTQPIFSIACSIHAPCMLHPSYTRNNWTTHSKDPCRFTRKLKWVTWNTISQHLSNFV
jgi:hypothetical protein